MSAPSAAPRPLNVLQVCDHLGWDGSRMHGVKRLFAWMIPRFDKARFNVSLVSLRKRDVSEETLDALGIEIEYLHRSKFDPATLPALLKIIDRRKVDVLHLHGYGATTFGRLAGAMRGLPTIRARARQPHRHALVSEGGRPGARAVYGPGDCRLGEHGRVRAHGAPGAAGTRQGRVPRRAARRVRRAAQSPADVAGARAELGIAPGEFAIGTITRLHESKGNSYLVEAAARVVRERPAARFLLAGEGPLKSALEDAGTGTGPRGSGSSSSAS